MSGRANGRGRKSTTTRIKMEGPKPKVVRVRKDVAARVKSTSSMTPSTGLKTSGSQENLPSDPSETNFSYDIRFNGPSSLLDVIHKATPDVKDLLMDECEIILECRICLNLFRSFSNFLCHKQQFCQQKYNPVSQPIYDPLVQCAENNTAEEKKSVVSSVFVPKKTPSKSSKIMPSPVKSNMVLASPKKQKTICILVRHDYEKEQGSSLPSLNETSQPQEKKL